MYKKYSSNNCSKIKLKLFKLFNNNFYIYLLSFLIPTTFLCLIFSFLGICPFGNNTPLVVDMDKQYIDFLAYFKTIILEKNNFFYSFSQTLGGNIFGFSAYYLFSPFNLICLFFSREFLPIAVTIIIILKIGLSGLTFNLFLKKTSNLSYNLTSLLFSTAYSLMAYNTVYYYTIIWLDDIILLPLIVLGIIKIYNGEKSSTFIVCLFLSFLTNYYIGFMIFIFSILFYLYMFLREFQLKNIKSMKTQQTKNFILSLVFTCGISMFILLPVLLSLLGSKIQSNIDIKTFEIILFVSFIILVTTIFLIFKTKKGKSTAPKVDIFNSKEDLKTSENKYNFINSFLDKYNLSIKTVTITLIVFITIFLLFIIASIISNYYPPFLVFKENLKLSNVFSKLYTNSFKLIQINNLDYPETAFPQIFCSILVLYMIFIYFFNSCFSKREKVISALFISIFLLSFCITAIGLIWHGFSKPLWFPARFSFLFNFFLIYTGNRCFLKLKEGINSKSLLCSTITFIIFTTSIVLPSSAIRSGVCPSNIYPDIALVIFFAIAIYICLGIYNKNIISIPHKKVVTSLLYSIFIISHFLNIYIDAFHSIEETQKNYVSESGLTNLNAYSNFTKDTEYTINKIKSYDSGLFRTERTCLKRINSPMQFNYYGLSHFGSSEKSFIRTFMEELGFKNYGNYLYYDKGNTLTADCLLGVKYLLNNESEFKKPYKPFFSHNNIQVYENPFALPIGFGVSSDILKINDNFKGKNPFENQSQLLEYMSGETYTGLFNFIEPLDIYTENLVQNNLDNSIKFIKIDNTKEAYIYYKVKIPNANNFYAYFSTNPSNPFKSNKITEATLYINDKPSTALSLEDGFNCILPLNFNKEEDVIFKIKLNEDSFTLNDVKFCYENADVLQKYYNTLAKEPFNAEIVSSSHIKGAIKIDNDNRLLLFSIPYEEGWKIKIDGIKAKKIKINNALTAVYINKGNHYIDMQYIPDGFIFGSVISVATFVIFLAYFSLFYKKCKNK